MGWEIHTRKNDNEELRYRVWSTITDGYRTDVLTKDELKSFLLLHAILDAVQKLLPPASYRNQPKTFSDYFESIEKTWIEESESQIVLGSSSAKKEWEEQVHLYKKSPDSKDEDVAIFREILEYVSKNIYKNF